MPAFPIHIAVLEADRPLPRTAAKYTSYGGVFTALLHASAESLGLRKEDLKITCWDVVGDGDSGWTYPDLDKDGVDAVLITGSRESDEWPSFVVVVVVFFFFSLLLSFCSPCVVMGQHDPKPFEHGLFFSIHTMLLR